MLTRTLTSLVKSNLKGLAEINNKCKVFSIYSSFSVVRFILGGVFPLQLVTQMKQVQKGLNGWKWSEVFPHFLWV